MDLPQPNNVAAEKPWHTSAQPHQEHEQDVRARRDSQEATEPRYWKLINCNRQGQVLKKGIPKANKPIPSSLSSAQEARGARMAHGGAFRSRTISPRENLQQKHSTILTDNPEPPTVTRNNKPSRAACERSHAGEARFLWFFLLR
jgi:hypothetical protein